MGEHKSKLGATGQFPRGKISRSDEGELTLGVAYDDVNGLVRIDFGKPVAWMAFEKDGAIAFAKAILTKAGATKITIELWKGKSGKWQIWQESC
jgi:hypothetical protein